MDRNGWPTIPELAWFAFWLALFITYIAHQI
jgi:hypothetical protein